MCARRLVTAIIAGGLAPLSACGGGVQAPEPVTVTEAVTVTATVTDTPSTTPVADVCDTANFLADFTEPVVMFCDGAWARAGQAQTDHVLLYRRADDRWHRHPHDGRSTLTGYTCYDEATLRAGAAPDELVGQVLLCEPVQ